MLRTEYVYLLSFFIGFSGYIVPCPHNDNVKISKTMHPYLLGKRNNYYLYNLEKSLYGIRATLEVLKNIIENGGYILFVNDSSVLNYAFVNNPSLDCIKWKRTALAQAKNVDLVFLSNIEKENIVEAHRKCMLLIGVGSPTMSKISYPFNLNIESKLLFHWFLSTVYTTCGRCVKIKLKKKKIIGLLGNGPNKILKSGCKNISFDGATSFL